MGKLKYNPGDLLGSHNILLLKRLPGGKGLFQCQKELCIGYDQCKNKNFIAAPSKVAFDKQKRCNKYKTNLDLRNKKFGSLTVLYPTGEKRNTAIVWHCQCDCGNTIDTTSHCLQQGDTTSCGCIQKQHITQLGRENFRDLTNCRFGKLLVIEKTEKRHKNRSIIWKCKCDCGNECEKSSLALLHDKVQSCGCLQSKGEQKIIEILQQQKINYITQYKFKNCCSENNIPLRFDFYLPDYNCCIEYDGEQHFICRNSGWNTKENLKETQHRDEIKNRYCKNNNIKLIRVPYTDFQRIDSNYLLERLKEDD